jgi:hypothetical protein
MRKLVKKPELKSPSSAISLRPLFSAVNAKAFHSPMPVYLQQNFELYKITISKHNPVPAHETKPDTVHHADRNCGRYCIRPYRCFIKNPGTLPAALDRINSGIQICLPAISRVGFGLYRFYCTAFF